MSPGVRSSHPNPAAEGRAERDFWESTPTYPVESEPPLNFTPPRARPSGLRRFGTKALFAFLFCGVLSLLAVEISVVLGVTWADVRSLTNGITGL